MFETAIIFLVSMWLISFPLSKKSSTREGFFISSRSMGTTTLSFTLAATTIGGSAIVVSMKLIEKYGAFGILIDIAGGLGLIVLSFTLASKIRETKSLTLPSILKKNLSKSGYKTISIALIIAEICWIALSIKGIQLLGNFSSIKLAVIVALTLAYSLTGGQWSVSKTDIIQFLLIVIGLGYYLFNPSGKTLTYKKLPDLFLIYLSTLMFLSHIIGPDIYSKLLSARDKVIAKKGAMLSGILKLLFTILLLLAVKHGFSLNNTNLIIFIIVFSAIVSSIDSMLITSTSILCEDLLKIESKKGIKAVTVAVTLLSYLLAIYSSEIISLVSSGYTILLITITFPVLSFFLLRKIKSYTLFVPLIVFLIVFIFTKSMEHSFFLSLLSGGFALAYTKIYG